MTNSEAFEELDGLSAYVEHAFSKESGDRAFDAIVIARNSIQENDKLKAEIEQLKKTWIPCSERLPDIELDDGISKRGSNAVYPVLATIKKKNFNNEEYYTTERAFYSEYYGEGERIFSDREVNKLNVIAWQPLPEPYKGEE